MIKIKVVKLDQIIHSIEITGHANADECGKDLVCASVSSISIGILNALDEMAKDTCLIECSGNRIYIEVILQSELAQTILNVGLIQLKTIEESYGKNVKIETHGGK